MAHFHDGKACWIHSQLIPSRSIWSYSRRWGQKHKLVPEEVTHEEMVSAIIPELVDHKLLSTH
eukprot:5488211-Amphidinium_carterae.3